MKFEIYCDESGLEALTKKDAHSYVAIGGIWLPAEFRDTLKMSIKDIKEKHNVFGELKWNKVSPKYLDLYKEVIDFFMEAHEIRFRVIIIESKIVDNITFNNTDTELGFYKFYYQLLHHWIYDFNSYSIFLDFKVNRNKGRLHELKKVLNNANLTSDIEQLQALPSEESSGIQLADVLTGIVSAKFNNETTSEAKKELIRHVETKLKRKICPTPKWEEKFNVFRINLRGGW